MIKPYNLENHMKAVGFLVECGTDRKKPNCYKQRAREMINVNGGQEI